MCFRRFLQVINGLLLGVLCSVSASATNLSNLPEDYLSDYRVLPNMASIQDVKEKKQTFFSFIYPITELANRKVQAEKAWLATMEKKLNKGQSLAYWERHLLSELGSYYKVDKPQGSTLFFKDLNRRVDIIPASLVLAQAANESAWGTSRFAVEGNNLFGQWCFTKGCGLVPKGRTAGATHEVASFSVVYESVSAYFRNLNTHTSYRMVRDIRQELRGLSLPVDSSYLVWGLERYSERGEEYIKDLLDMMNQNKLQSYDKAVY